MKERMTGPGERTPLLRALVFWACLTIPTVIITVSTDSAALMAMLISSVVSLMYEWINTRGET